MSQYGFNLLEPIHPVDNPAFFTAHSDPEEVYRNKNPEKGEKDNRNLRRRVENQAAAILHLPDPTLQTHLSDIHIRNKTTPIGSPIPDSSIHFGITPDPGKILTKVANKCGRIAEQTGIKIDCSKDNDQQMQHAFSSSIDQQETPISPSSSSSSSSFHLNPHSETMEVGDPEDRFLFSLLTRQSSGSTEDRSPFSLLERQSSGLIDSSEMRDSAHLVRSSSTLPLEDRSSSQPLLPLRTDALEFSNHTSYTNLSMYNIQAVAHCLMQEEQQGGVQVTEKQIEDCCRQNGLQVNAACIKELLPKARENRDCYVPYFEDVTNAHPKPTPPPKELTPPKTDSSVHSDISHCAPTEGPIEEEYINAAVEYFTEKNKNENKNKRLNIKKLAKDKNLDYLKLKKITSNTKHILLEDKPIKDYKKQAKAIVSALKKAKIPIEIKTNQVTTLKDFQTAFAVFHNEQPIEQRGVKTTSLHPSTFSNYKTAITRCLEEEKKKNRQLSLDEISECCRWGQHGRKKAQPAFVQELLPKARKYRDIYTSSVKKASTEENLLCSNGGVLQRKHSITRLSSQEPIAKKQRVTRDYSEDDGKDDFFSSIDQEGTTIESVATHESISYNATVTLPTQQPILSPATSAPLNTQAETTVFFQDPLATGSKKKQTTVADLQKAFAAFHDGKTLTNAVKNTSLDRDTLSKYQKTITRCLQEEKEKNRQLSLDAISRHCGGSSQRKMNPAFVHKLLPEARKYMTAIYEPLFEKTHCSSSGSTHSHSSLLSEIPPNYFNNLVHTRKSAESIATYKSFSYTVSFQNPLTTTAGKKRIKRPRQKTVANLQKAFDEIHHGQNVQEAAKRTGIPYLDLSRYIAAVANCLKQEKDRGAPLTNEHLQECCPWNDRIQVDLDFVKELLPEARKYKETIYISSLEDLHRNKPIRATSTSSAQNAPEVNKGSRNKSKKRKFG